MLSFPAISGLRRQDAWGDSRSEIPEGRTAEAASQSSLPFSRAALIKMDARFRGHDVNRM